MRIALALVASVVAAPVYADDSAHPAAADVTKSAAPGETRVTPVQQEPQPQPVKDIVVTSRPDRPRGTTFALAAGATAGVILGGVGLYYHLDSRDASESLNAHKATGTTWNADREATYDRAHSSATTAAVFYGIGGVFLVGTAIAYMLTEPDEETTIIHPHVGTPVVAPTRGGAVVGGMWSF